MKIINLLAVIFLICITLALAILSATHYDEQLLPSDKQIFFTNLKKDKSLINELADKNNVIIYTVNNFEKSGIKDDKEDSITYISIYTNTKLKDSPFYLDKGKKAKYQTFNSNIYSTVYNIDLLKKQDFADFWIVDKNNNYDNFVKDLNSHNIKHKSIDIIKTKYEYDYAEIYDKAIIALIFCIILLKISLELKNCKALTLHLMYDTKIKVILNKILLNSIRYLVIYTIVIVLTMIFLYFHNNLARFDIVYKTYSYYNLVAITCINVVDIIFLSIYTNKVNFISSLKNNISSGKLFYVINILIVISLGFSSYFFNEIIAYTQSLNHEFISKDEFKNITINNLNKYAPYISARDLERYDEDYANYYHGQLNKFTMYAQKKYDAVFAIYSEGMIIVNANYFKENKIKDANGIVVDTSDVNRIITIKKPISIYDYHENTIKKSKKIKQIKYNEVLLTGYIDFYFDLNKKTKNYQNDLNLKGLSNVIGGLRQVKYEIFNSHSNTLKYLIYQNTFNYLFFFSLFLFCSYINFHIFIEYNKKKIALQKIYNKSFHFKYRIVILFYAFITLILTRYFASDKYILYYLITLALLYYLSLRIYSNFIEKRKAREWLS